MDKDNNIVKSFIKRTLFAMFFLSITSSAIIYFYQNYSFHNSLANDIKYNLDITLDKHNKNIRYGNPDIEKDIRNFMQELGFIYIEIYDKNKKEIFSFKSKRKVFLEKLSLIKQNKTLFLHTFPDDESIDYKFVEVGDENYFLQIFYPIYKNNQLFGYIEGISHQDKELINRFKKSIYATIVIVVLTVLIFGIIIFPLIYFAYKKLNKNSLDLLASNIMTINTLGNAIALRDSDTNEHNYRVTIYVIKFAEHLNLKNEEIQILIKGAFLHDVGKIGISDNILLSDSKLNHEEFEIMKEHVLKGAQLVEKNPWLKESKEVILYHHEKFDGSGYLKGLKGKKIPKYARIFSIVDVFDALTSKRPYKESFSYEKSIEILKKASNVHFDEEYLEAFFDISEDFYEKIRLKSEDDLKELLESLIKKYF